MTNILKSHWAAVTVCSMVILGFFIAQTDNWAIPRLLEASLLIDLAIIAPILLVIGYWNATTPKRRLLRGLGFAGLGLSFAAWIIPQEHHLILRTFEPLFALVGDYRGIFIAIVMLMEVWLFLTIAKALFQSNSREEMEAITQDENKLPPFLKKLMIAEVTFWKWVAKKLRGK